MTLVRASSVKAIAFPRLDAQSLTRFVHFVFVAGQTGIRQQNRRRCAPSEDDLRTESSYCTIAALALGRAPSSILGISCNC